MIIFLIGFMGSGKSVVGKKLSESLNIDFIDMDDYIEALEKKKISDIFKENGEKYFRQLETNLLKMLISKKNTVISTGGGVVCSDENVNILKLQRNVIFLNASEETIQKNIFNEVSKRPLLNESQDINKTIRELLKKRINKYNEVSNITISVDNKNIDEVVTQLLVYIR